MKRERAKCPSCGKVMAVQTPAGGDGSVDVYPRHKNANGVRCDESRREVRREAYA